VDETHRPPREFCSHPRKNPYTLYKSISTIGFCKYIKETTLDE
jgi:hypothetical protein